jgi:hypothetical protein
MSSRQEEKERRRQERLAAEKAAADSAARKRRIGFATAGVLATAAVAAIVVAVTAGGGGSKSKTSSTPAPSPAALQAKAKAAGCTVSTFPSEGRNHTTGKVTYKTNPPTSGDHYPTPASDGIYDPGSTPEIGKLVHALEHGRIQYQYKPGTPPAVVAQLQTLMKDPINGEPGGFVQMLFENKTGMPYQVAATAWTHMIACPTFKGAATLDALRAFRAAYILAAPEKIAAPE